MMAKIEFPKRDVQEDSDAANDRAAQSAFLSKMGHELRTPLNAIIGYSDLLLSSEAIQVSGELLDDIREINRAGKDLNLLLNDIMEVVRIEAGAIEVQVTDFDLKIVLDEAILGVRPLAAQNENTIAIDISPDISRYRGDREKIGKVVKNLLQNAAKFTIDGAIDVRVASQLADGLDLLRIEISDTGPGIAPESLEKIFEPFFQGDSSSARKFGGTGLGLTICRELVRLMGGTLEVQSQAGVGTCFSVELPNAGNQCLSSAADVTEAEDCTGPDKGGTVLVIDDDRQSRSLLSRNLSAIGYEVATASKGVEGIALAKKLRPRAIVLDILMPEMDGWEVLQHLKSDPTLAPIPVLICSIEDNRNRARKLGAFCHLVKPISEEQLWQKMRQL